MFFPVTRMILLDFISHDNPSVLKTLWWPHSQQDRSRLHGNNALQEPPPFLCQCPPSPLHDLLQPRFPWDFLSLLCSPWWQELETVHVSNRICLSWPLGNAYSIFRIQLKNSTSSRKPSLLECVLSTAHASTSMTGVVHTRDSVSSRSFVLDLRHVCVHPAPSVCWGLVQQGHGRSALMHVCTGHHSTLSTPPRVRPGASPIGSWEWSPENTFNCSWHSSVTVSSHSPALGSLWVSSPFPLGIPRTWWAWLEILLGCAWFHVSRFISTVITWSLDMIQTAALSKAPAYSQQCFHNSWNMDATWVPINRRKFWYSPVLFLFRAK